MVTFLNILKHFLNSFLSLGKRIIFPILFSLSFFELQAQQNDVKLLIPKDSLLLTDYIQVLANNKAGLNFETILHTRADSWRLTKGIYEQPSGWFKLDLKTNFSITQYILYLPNITKAKAYLVQQNKVIATYEGGEFELTEKKVVLSSRKSFVIPLDKLTQGDFQIFIYAENIKENHLILDWELRKYSNWLWQNNYTSIKDAMLHTFIWIFLAANLVLFIFFRERVHLYYSGYLLSVSIYFLWFSGYTSNYILGGFPKLNFSLKTIQNIAPILYWIFISHFYSKNDFKKGKKQLFYIIMFSNLLVVFAELYWIFFSDSYNLLLSDLANLVSCASMLGASVVFLCCIWNKSKQSMLVSAGVITVAISYLITIICFYLGISGYRTIFQVGFIIEVLLFTLSLVLQFKKNELSRVEAQKRLITELRKNKHIQESYRHELEEKVLERTKEIEHKNKEILEQRNELLGNSNELQELNSELVTQAETIQFTNERLYKNEKILRKAYQKLKETQKELELKNEAIRKINKDQEKLIASRNRDIIKTKKELDDFLYRTSHNLKGPVARIKGLQELLKIELKDHDLEGEYLERLSRVIEKMEVVFEKLNAISLINRVSSKPEHCNLLDVVSKTVASLTDKIDAYHAEIIEDTQPISLPVNPKIIQIILRYLLENSFQFRDKIRPLKIGIHVSEHSDNFVNISVTDNGIGIENKIIGKIFNMFYIGSLESEGDGLGLYIVKKGIDRLKGFINVESKHNMGTTIRILLPKPTKQSNIISSTSHKASPL